MGLCARAAPLERRAHHTPKEHPKMSTRQSFRATSLALTLIALITAAFAVSAFAGPTTGKAEAGKAIYKTKCVACHKADGTGGFKVSGLPTSNWTLKKTWDATRTDDYLRDCITNGKMKDGMIAWGKTKQLTPVQIEDLIAYIKTFKAAAK
jgi:mono/diheme cytochrome c family protein